MTKMRSVCKQTINGQEFPDLTVSSKCEINNSPVVSKHNECMMAHNTVCTVPCRIMQTEVLVMMT